MQFGGAEPFRKYRKTGESRYGASRATYYKARYKKYRSKYSRARGWPFKKRALVYNQSNAPNEIKCVDLGDTNINTSTLGGFVLLNGTTEGAGFFNRIGRKISMKSIEIRAFYQPQDGAYPAVFCGRFMVLYDKQTNGAAPALNDVLLNYTSAGGTSTSVLGFLNMNNRDRFTVLADETVLLVPTGANGSPAAGYNFFYTDLNMNANESGGRINIHRFIKLKGLETVYRANVGDVTGISTGALWFFCVSNDPDPVAYRFILNTRLRFYD